MYLNFHCEPSLRNACSSKSTVPNSSHVCIGCHYVYTCSRGWKASHTPPSSFALAVSTVRAMNTCALKLHSLPFVVSCLAFRGCSPSFRYNSLTNRRRLGPVHNKYQGFYRKSPVNAKIKVLLCCSNSSISSLNSALFFIVHAILLMVFPNLSPLRMIHFVKIAKIFCSVVSHARI